MCWFIYIKSNIINLISLSCNALIIVYEKMDMFAYIYLLEALLKLGAVYLLFISLILDLNGNN